MRMQRSIGKVNKKYERDGERWKWSGNERKIEMDSKVCEWNGERLKERERIRRRVGENVRLSHMKNRFVCFAAIAVLENIPWNKGIWLSRKINKPGKPGWKEAQCDFQIDLRLCEMLLWPSRPVRTAAIREQQSWGDMKRNVRGRERGGMGSGEVGRRRERESEWNTSNGELKVRVFACLPCEIHTDLVCFGALSLARSRSLSFPVVIIIFPFCFIYCCAVCENCLLNWLTFTSASLSLPLNGARSIAVPCV